MSDPQQPEEPQDPRPLDITQDPDLLRRLLDNQANEIFTRQTEQELRRQEIETAHEYSLKLLDAQLIDRQRDREHQRSTNSSGCIILGFLSVLFAGGICYALYLNKDPLVMEFLKAAVFLLTGGLGGWAAKVVKDKNGTTKQ